jgi:hypothetical protein
MKAHHVPLRQSLVDDVFFYFFCTCPDTLHQTSWWHWKRQSTTLRNEFPSFDKPKWTPYDFCGNTHAMMACQDYWQTPQRRTISRHTHGITLGYSGLSPAFFLVASCGHFFQKHQNLWLFIVKTPKPVTFEGTIASCRSNFPFYPKNNKTWLFNLKCIIMPYRVLWLLPTSCPRLSRKAFKSLHMWATRKRQAVVTRPAARASH